MPTPPAWHACALPQSVMVASVCTNARYFTECANLAFSAKKHVGAPCVAVALSSELRSQRHALLEPLSLPHAASWRPEPLWCSRKLSGWRHASVLKTAMLAAVLQSGFTALVVDADWRFIANPLSHLLGCAATSGLDLLGTRDDHFVNVGLLFVRPTPSTRQLAHRAANRSTRAWDQALLNEEMAGARASLRCCVANGFFKAHFARSEEVHAMKKTRAAASDCAVSLSPTTDFAIGPPESLSGRPTWKDGWGGSRFNPLQSHYHHRCPGCYNQCSSTHCTFDLANASASACSVAQGAYGSPVYDGATSPPFAAARRPAPRVDTAAGSAAIAGGCAPGSSCCRRHPRAHGCRSDSPRLSRADGRSRGLAELGRSRRLSEQWVDGRADGRADGRVDGRALATDCAPGSSCCRRHPRVPSCIGRGERDHGQSSAAPPVATQAAPKGAPPLAGCAVVRGPVCMAASHTPTADDVIGCSLPYNAPGVADYLQLDSRRPMAPPIRLPPHRTGGRSSLCAATPPRQLLIWRQSFPFNLMEFIRRLLGAAPALLTLRSTSLIYVPLDRNFSLPRFYHGALSPFGAVSSALAPSAEAPLAFSEVRLCCVRKPTKIDGLAAARLIQRIVAAHAEGATRAEGEAAGVAADAGPPLQDPPPARSETVDVTFVTRSPPKWAIAGRGRQLVRGPELLAECRRSGRRCEEVEFDRLSFGEALRRVRSSRVIVGFHGAGLANSVFTRPQSLVLEVMPQGFARPGGFGRTKYDFLRALNLSRVLLVGRESDPTCVRSARGVWEHLRDCDVALAWPAVEAALGQGRGWGATHQIKTFQAVL